MSSLPPLPRIDGDVDLLLEVYTHSSLRRNGTSTNDEYGDTERLAELGSKILDLVVTFHYYGKKPMLDATQIAESRQQAISDEKLEAWLDSYGLRQKLRSAPGSQFDTHEIRCFFNTYIGALYIRNGMASIQNWVTRLIDPEAELAILDPSMLKDPRQQSWSGPAPPPTSPPPLPHFPPNSPQNGGSISSLVSLALVNQTAAQKGYTVTYPADQVGPSHQPTWTVRCCLNGQEQGRGTGKSQKSAKDEAARQAWVNMGWGPRA